MSPCNGAFAPCMAAVTIANFQIVYMFCLRVLIMCLGKVPHLAVTIANFQIASFYSYITFKLFQIVQIAFFIQPPPSPIFRLCILKVFLICMFCLLVLIMCLGEVPNVAVTFANFQIASFYFCITFKIFQIVQIAFFIQPSPSPIFRLCILKVFLICTFCLRVLIMCLE